MIIRIFYGYQNRSTDIIMELSFNRKSWSYASRKILIDFRNYYLPYVSHIVNRHMFFFINKGFTTIISTMFQPISPSGFCRTRESTRNFELRPFFSPLGFASSDSISHSRVQVLSITCLQSGLNLQPPDDCLLRRLGNQCL